MRVLVEKPGLSEAEGTLRFRKDARCFDSPSPMARLRLAQHDGIRYQNCYLLFQRADELHQLLNLVAGQLAFIARHLALALGNNGG